MRTAGTFVDVYRAARELFSDNSGSPVNPVVRRENGEWMLESGLDPACDADLEIDLDQFHSLFADAYGNEEYVPAEEDLTRYIYDLEQ